MSERAAKLGLVALALALAACETTALDPQPDSGTGNGDSGFRLDAGSLIDGGQPDVGAPDAGSNDSGPVTDAGAVDAGAVDGGPIDGGGVPDAGTRDASVPCGFDQMGAADKARVILLSHTFTANPSVPGTEIRALGLAGNGTITDGVRLDVGAKIQRIEFVPSGQYALALGEDGELVSVRIESANSMSVVDMVSLPAAGFEDLRLLPDGETAFAVGSNVDTSSGISSVRVNCDGTLEVLANEFFNIRLSESLALVPGTSRAVLLGGQTVFAPIDNDDLRLISYAAGSGWTPIDSFDIWMDFIDAGRIGLSPNGQTLIVPNGSPFSTEGGQVSVLTVNATGMSELIRLMNLDDAREALFSPDGSTAVVSQLTPGHVVVLRDPGTGWQVVDTIVGIGLADQMAGISRGPLSGRVYLPSIDPNDPNDHSNLSVIEFGMPGVVSDLGQFDIGGGSSNIPVGVAVQP